MNGKRMAGAIAGGLVAGLGITAMMMAGEKKSGTPSELTDLERAGARQLGVRAVPPSDRLPDAAEQAVVQGSHLLLSATAGAVYAATVDEDAGVLPSGIVFGLAFYAAMHWITGPLLGLKKPEWQADAATIGTHTMVHLVFGVATAAGAKAAANA